MEDALQAELVPLEGCDGLTEDLLGTARGAAVDAGRIDLLPVDGYVVGLEDGLDALRYLGTDTVAGDEGDGVLAAELGGLEDVGLDGGEGSRGILEVRRARGCTRKAL